MLVSQLQTKSNVTPSLMDIFAVVLDTGTLLKILKEVRLSKHCFVKSPHRPIKDAITEAPVFDIEELGDLCASCPKRSEGCHESCEVRVE